MATATLELINPYSKYGLKRRLAYDEIIGLINEYETITGNLPDRIAILYRASPESSFFDGSDALEILKEQQNRIMEREMRDILMRRNARLNERTFNVDRIQAAQSNTAPAEVQPDRETLSAQVQADLQRREAQIKNREQQTGEAFGQELSSQSKMPVTQGLISENLSPIVRLIPSPTGRRDVPQLPIPSRQVEQIDLTTGEDMRAEEEEFCTDEQMMTARENTGEMFHSKLFNEGLPFQLIFIELCCGTESRMAHAIFKGIYGNFVIRATEKLRAQDCRAALSAFLVSCKKKRPEARIFAHLLPPCEGGPQLLNFASNTEERRGLHKEYCIYILDSSVVVLSKCDDFSFELPKKSGFWRDADIQNRIMNFCRKLDTNLYGTLAKLCLMTEQAIGKNYLIVATVPAVVNALLIFGLDCKHTTHVPFDQVNWHSTEEYSSMFCQRYC